MSDNKIPKWSVEEWRQIVEGQSKKDTFFVCYEDCVQMIKAYTDALKTCAALEAKLQNLVMTLELISRCKEGKHDAGVDYVYAENLARIAIEKYYKGESK